MLPAASCASSVLAIQLKGQLHPHTWQTLIGLLACTGLRISEAMRLKTGDVDWKESLLIIRESKFGKYLSCSRFPKCKGKIPLDREGNKIDVFKPIPIGKTCTKCNKNVMLLRKSARGYFLACSGFPRCRNIEKVTDSEVEQIINGAKPKV